MAQVVFDNTNTLPATPGGVTTFGPSSLSYSVAQTAEFGDYVVLGGSDRLLTNVTIPMAIFAPNGGSQAGNPFVLPITLNIYAVNTSGATPAPGALLNTITQNVNVPGVTVGTSGRVYFNVDFSAIGMNITLPNAFIWSVAYDATAAPSDSLNTVVTTSPAAPAVGNYGDPNGVFIDSNFVGPDFQYSSFIDLGQFLRPSARFSAIPEPSTWVTLGVLGAGLLAFRRRR